MARAKQQPVAHTDWRFVWTLGLSLAAAIATWTTQQNEVQSLNKDLIAVKNDVKDFLRVRERTVILETKFDNIDTTLRKIAVDVERLLVHQRPNTRETTR